MEIAILIHSGGSKGHAQLRGELVALTRTRELKGVPSRMKGQSKVALVAVSRRGAELALRLWKELPEADILIPDRLSQVRESGVATWQGPLRQLMTGLFSKYRGLVLFGSVGMAVRLIAPLIRDKRSDPAVVVVDDAGSFAVSLLSGHLGGANLLVKRVAGLLGAVPVITTASDVLGLPSVDLLGWELGWRLEREENVTRVSAAVVNGEIVGVLQEAGEPDWWPPGEPFPPHLIRLSSREELVACSCTAALVITDLSVSIWQDKWPPTVIYRPRSLAVGIGCHRGTSVEEIVEAVTSALDSRGLVLASVRMVATAELKRGEEGLRKLAEQLGAPLVCFPSDELRQVTPNPSEVVRRYTGSGGVSEPAALLASGAKSLLVPKFKTSSVTVAVARMVGQ